MYLLFIAQQNMTSLTSKFRVYGSNRSVHTSTSNWIGYGLSLHQSCPHLTQVVQKWIESTLGQYTPQEVAWSGLILIGEVN